MTDFVQILSNFGFPIALAVYLLFRFEKKLDALEEANEKVLAQLNDAIKIIENCKGNKK